MKDDRFQSGGAGCCPVRADAAGRPYRRVAADALVQREAAELWQMPTKQKGPCSGKWRMGRGAWHG